MRSSVLKATHCANIFALGTGNQITATAVGNNFETHIARNMRDLLAEGTPATVSHLQSRIGTDNAWPGAPVRIGVSAGRLQDDSIVLQPCYNNLRKHVKELMREEPPLLPHEMLVVIVKHIRTLTGTLSPNSIPELAVVLVCSGQ